MFSYSVTFIVFRRRMSAAELSRSSSIFRLAPIQWLDAVLVSNGSHRGHSGIRTIDMLKGALAMSRNNGGADCFTAGLP